MIELLLFALLIATELIYFKIADRYNIIDQPNQRSSHSQITLRGGGIVFYFAILFYSFFYGFQFPFFMIGLTMISLISFADDLRPQSAKIRLIIHCLALLLLFYEWSLFSEVWYFSAIALIMCIGFLNAYNFMDGINGITGGYSLLVVATLWYVNLCQNLFIDSNIITTLIISLLVFNYFNFRKKAKCFAGDVGAIGIAFSILFLLGKLIISTNDFTYIIFLVVYAVDSVLTIIHRLFLRENIFEAHRKHAYQLLANELKIPHIMVAGMYMGIQTLINILFLMIGDEKLRTLFLLMCIVVLSLVYIVFKRKFFHLHTSKKS
jgi:UDP-N-acetylmuramyl pentapeptide phosphotransferase/UDP-N-acetylglucosamine-1-phosphate transferase